MKKTFLLLIIVFSSHVFADQPETPAPSSLEKSYTYWSIGAGPCPLPIPILSVGKRTMKGDFSIDTGVSLATLVRANALYGYVNLLHYSSKKPSSQIYTGIGALAGAAQIIDLDDPFLFVSPQFIFGKEFLTQSGERQFFEVSIKCPLTIIDHGWRGWTADVVEIPIISLKYGFAF